MSEKFICCKCLKEKPVEEIAVKHRAGECECKDCYTDIAQMAINK